MTQHSSLLASLGAALHLPMRAGHAEARSSVRQRPAPLEAFEKDLATRLCALETAEDAAYLTLPWLKQAMAMVLETHTQVDTLIPHLRGHWDGDERWMADYLDDSAKLLDCSSVLREALADLESYQRLVEIALHALQGQDCPTESQFVRAKNALHDCIDSVRRKDEEAKQGGHHKSRLDSYGSMLRTMGDRLAAPKPYQAVQGQGQGQGFLVAVYGAKVFTIYVCGLVISAISFRPRKPLFQIGVNQQPLWSSALLSLLHKVKEETERRKATAPFVLLQELDNVDTAASKAYHFLDAFLATRSSGSFPLTQEQINDLGKLVEIFRASATELRTGVVALDQQLNQLFRSLVTNRVAVLGCLSASAPSN